VYLKITKYKYKGRLYRHAKIVEGYRVGQKVKHRTILNIGQIKSDDDLERAKRLLESMRMGETLIKLKDLQAESVLEYGLVHTGQRLWEKLGLQEVLSEAVDGRKHKFDFPGISLLLAVNRLYRPSSEREAYEWMKHEAFHHVPVELHYLYRSLDLLTEYKDPIERGFFKKLVGGVKLSTDLVFYDLTSTYFEGNGPKLAEHGYSRDHRPDLKQVVIGVAICDGIPMAHWVWPGSTADKSTLKSAVADIKRRFRIDRAIFVADRGVFAVKNLEELEREEFKYILSTKRRKNGFLHELLVQPVEEPRIVKVEGERKYILCVNPEVRRQTLEDLDHSRREAERKLEHLRTELVGSKKRRDLLNKMVKKALGRTSKFFEWELSEGRFSYRLKERVWEYERAIAGKLLLVTSSDLRPREVEDAYRELKVIEQFFADLKHLVSIRPVYHTADRRVEGHVFVCVLALLLKKLIDRGLGTSGNQAIKELKRIKMIKCRIGKESVFISTKLTKTQKSIFQKLGIEEPSTFVGA
jgi:transposase